MIGKAALERLRLYRGMGMIVVFNDYPTFLRELKKSYDRKGYIISSESIMRREYWVYKVKKDCKKINMPEMTGYLCSGQPIRVISDEPDRLLGLSINNTVVLVV